MSPPTPIAASQVEPGTIPAIKDVYKGKASCACCITWSAEPQKKITTSVATDTSGYAILARQTEGHGDFGRELKLHSMVIQSDLIKEVLNDVLAGYPGITTGLENLTVEAPFAGFYHRWGELIEALEASTGTTKEHLTLLISILEVEFEGMHKTVADLLKNNVTEYRYIWAIFQPGEHIITDIHGQDAIMLLESGVPYDETQYSGGHRGWSLRAKHIDYNGTMTGFGRTTIKIQDFTGTMALDQLEAIPLDQHENKKELVVRLAERGRIFDALRTATFQEYSGRAVLKGPERFDGHDTQVNGRVMVDPFAYFQFNRQDNLSLQALTAPPPAILVGPPFINNRALSAGQAGKIHVLTFDYRGFGRSTGKPSESGLIIDTLAMMNWAMKIAGIPPSRILIFGQSLGTAVSIAESEQLALRSPPVVFAGTVLVAPFVDVATLVSTYRIAGTIPILSPLAMFPPLFNYLQRFIWDKWSSKDHIAKYVQGNEANKQQYHLTIMHAQDDYDIPWHHTPILFWHAVNASMRVGIEYEELELKKTQSKIDLGSAGSTMEWRTSNGIIREEILKTGLHDVIMGYPIITMAVMRIFGALDPTFTC